METAQLCLRCADMYIDVAEQTGYTVTVEDLYPGQPWPTGSLGETYCESKRCCEFAILACRATKIAAQTA